MHPCETDAYIYKILQMPLGDRILSAVTGLSVGHPNGRAIISDPPSIPLDQDLLVGYEFCWPAGAPQRDPAAHIRAESYYFIGEAVILGCLFSLGEIDAKEHSGATFPPAGDQCGELVVGEFVAPALLIEGSALVCLGMVA